MLPVSGATWASRSFTSRLSFHIGLQLTSVVAPGIVIATEIAFILDRLSSHASRTELTPTLNSLSNTRGAALILFSVIGLAVSYVTGWVCRELGFWIAGLLEGKSRRLKTLQRFAVLFRDKNPSEEIIFDSKGHRLKSVRKLEASSREGNPPREILATDEMPIIERIRLVLGDEAIDGCIALHPILRILAHDTARHSDIAATRGQWDHKIANQEIEAFTYCKLWLRRYVPELSVDRIEVDINILASTIIPVLLLAIIVIMDSRHPAIVAILAVPLSLAMESLLVRRIARNRRDERWEAIRNLIEDHAMQTALACYPKPMEEPSPNPPNPRHG